MAKKTTTPKTVKCSFCGKAQENVKKIIAGPGVYICDECIAICRNIIEDGDYEEEVFVESFFISLTFCISC